MAPPKTLDHPSFGPCELVPSTIAVKWKTPVSSATLESTLAEHSLALSTDAPKSKEKASALQDAMATLGDIGDIEASASIDENRSRLIKGFAVLNLPDRTSRVSPRRIRQRSGSAAPTEPTFGRLSPTHPSSRSGARVSVPTSMWSRPASKSRAPEHAGDVRLEREVQHRRGAQQSPRRGRSC